MLSTFRRVVLLSVAAGSFWALSADIFTEAGDSGELLGTANIASVVSPLTAISGTLIDLDSSAGTMDDVDLYQIFIFDPAAFSVSVTSNLSVDNDSQLFLFNALGNQVLSDDDDGPGLRPEFFAGEVGGPAGVYYVAFGLWDTDPTFTGGVLSGWNRNPVPFQTGDYTLNLTGTSPAAIPEPSSVVLLSTVVVGLGLTVRRRFQQRA